MLPLIRTRAFYYFQQASLVLIIANFFFSAFYLASSPATRGVSWSAVFLFPVLGVLLLAVSSFLIVRPHFYTFPKGLVLHLLGQDYLEVLYQIIRRQILVIGFLLQILLAYTNWGNLSNAFVDPASFSTYLFWVLVSAVVVATVYYLFLLAKEAMKLGLVKNS